MSKPISVRLLLIGLLLQLQYCAYGMSTKSKFSPILKSADFDGDGEVTELDRQELRDNFYRDDDSENPGNGNTATYFSIYDLNGDREVNNDDDEIIKEQIKSNTLSDVVDKTFVTLFKEGLSYNDVDYTSPTTIQSLFEAGFYSNLVNIKGRGVYWFTPAGVATFYDPTLVNINEVQGFLVGENKKIVALVWGSNALPSFESEDGSQGVFDFFTCGPFVGGTSIDCEWMELPVVSLIGGQPQISSDPCEKWFPETFCLYESDGNGMIDRGLTFSECNFQTSYDPNPVWLSGPIPLGPIVWSPPSWLLHMWLFEPNTDGLYAQTNEAVAPNGLDNLNDRTLSEFNRPMAEFFDEDSTAICDRYDQ